MKLLKSKLLNSCDEVTMTLNHMKNAEYFKDIK